MPLSAAPPARLAFTTTVVVAAGAAAIVACGLAFPIHERGSADDAGLDGAPRGPAGGDATGVACSLDLATDAHNCGACGNDCRGGTCLTGTCQVFVCGPPVVPGGRTEGLAVDDTYLFWTASAGTGSAAGALLRCPLLGCDQPTLLAESLRSPALVALDRDNVYFTEYGGSSRTGSVRRCPRDGAGHCETTAPLQAAVDHPNGIAVADGRVYWTTGYNDPDGGTVSSCGLPGCDAAAPLASGLKRPSSLAVGAGHAYWTSQLGDGGLFAFALAGDGGSTSFGPAHAANGLTLDRDAGRLYWTDPTSLHEAVLDAGVPVAIESPASTQGGKGIAADDDAVYFAAAQTTTALLLRVTIATGATAVIASDDIANGDWSNVAVGDELIYWTSGGGNTVLCLAKPPR